MKAGLMGRIGKGSHGWTSRDYNIDVPCRRSTCPAHHGLNNICMMPSAIKINGQGVCQTGQDLIDAEAKQPKEPPKKPDGD